VGMVKGVLQQRACSQRLQGIFDQQFNVTQNCRSRIRDAHKQRVGARAVCPTPPQDPANGAFACPTSTYINKPCYATCNAPFLGQPYVTCLGDGTWSKTVGTCYPGGT